MRKSFKRAIAVILTVLMVVCSFPFTALAGYDAVKTRQPNYILQFGTFYPASDANYTTFAQGWNDYSTVTDVALNTNSPDVSNVGLFNVPVDFDFEYTEKGGVSGNLYIDAAKAQNTVDSLGLTTDGDATPYPVDGNIEYGTGDYFTVTTICDNITEVNSTEIVLQYGDNIEPAGMYSTSKKVGTRVQKKYAMGTIADYEAVTGSKEWVAGGPNYLTDQSMCTLYGYDNEDLGGSTVDTEKRLMKVTLTPREVPLTTKHTSFVDPATGLNPTEWDEDYVNSSNEYEYTNCLIGVTFVFKITDGTKPIVFDMFDPTNKEPGYIGTGGGGFGGAWFQGLFSDGVGDEYKVTYAKNTVANKTFPNQVAGVDENYGSMQLYFMGYNSNSGKYLEGWEPGGDIPTCDHAETTTTETVTTEPTCTTAGAKTVTVTCNKCNEVISTNDATMDALGHDMTKEVSAKVEATCEAPGKEAVIGCSRCDYTEGGEAIAQLTHTPVSADNAKEPTCTEDGKKADTVCSVCGALITAGDVIAATGHKEYTVASNNNGTHTFTCTKGDDSRVEDCNFGAWVVTDPAAYKHDGTKTRTCETCGYVETATIPATDCTHEGTKTETLNAAASTAATCEATGTDVYDIVCDTCGNVVDTKNVTTDALGHDMTKVVTEAKAPTCTEAGNEVQMGCTRCDKVNELVTIAALDHTAGEPVVTTVPAEIDKEGSITTVVNCTVCGAEISKDVQTIPALVGYTVTVDRTDLGYVTLDGTDVSTGGSAKFVEGSKVTLTAAPVDGATFVGWTANGSTLVSTDTTFTTTVLANIKFTPVFEIAAADSFTVQYVDAYGNVVAIYTEVTADTVASIKAPEVPNRPGYTADGWSITDLSTVTSSVVISAQYVKNTADLYTVTVPEGATVMVDGAVVEAPYEFAFDTKVTVSLAGIDAWTIDGTAVGYGSEFTFYVTADVALEAAAGITATPSVALIGKESIGAPGAVQAMFKATRTMADGCKFVQAGFIYGKGNIGDAKLADVNGSTVKAAYAKTSVEQFSLTYGLRAQSGTIQARAFLAYVDAQGQNQVVYTPVSTYTYGVD